MTSPTPPGSPQGSGERALQEVGAALAQKFRQDREELESLRAQRQELLPDHCYRCEKPCKYAGAEKDTGAQRCAACLLETERQAWEEERAKLKDRCNVLQEWQTEAVRSCAEKRCTMKDRRLAELEKTEEEQDAALASLREENAGNEAEVDRLRKFLREVHATLGQMGVPRSGSASDRIRSAIQSLTKSRDANLAEATRLRTLHDGVALALHKCKTDEECEGCGCRILPIDVLAQDASKEIARLQAVIEADRPIANAEGRELRRLRARVEELEGLLQEIREVNMWRNHPGHQDYDDARWEELFTETIPSALSSLGEQGGEVRGG